MPFQPPPQRGPGLAGLAQQAAMGGVNAPTPPPNQTMTDMDIMRKYGDPDPLGPGQLWPGNTGRSGGGAGPGMIMPGQTGRAGGGAGPLLPPPLPPNPFFGGTGMTEMDLQPNAPPGIMTGPNPLPQPSPGPAPRPSPFGPNWNVPPNAAQGPLAPPHPYNPGPNYGG